MNEKIISLDLSANIKLENKDLYVVLELKRD